MVPKRSQLIFALALIGSLLSFKRIPGVPSAGRLSSPNSARQTQLPPLERDEAAARPRKAGDNHKLKMKLHKTEATVPRARNNCGVYYYYHVPKTGGTSVLLWQNDISKGSKSKVKHKNFYYNNIAQRLRWKRDLETIHSEIQKIVSRLKVNQLKWFNSWYSVHHHHHAPGLRLLIPILRQWRQLLEAEGCTLVTAVTLREPKSWIESAVTFNKKTDEQVPKYVKYKNVGQAKYLLYNKYDQKSYPSKIEAELFNPENAAQQYLSLSPSSSGHNLTVEEMEEVIEYLQQDFDIVGQTHNLDGFLQQSMSLTGWTNLTRMMKSKSPHALKSKQRIFSPHLKSLMAESVQQDEMIWRRVFEE